MKLTNKLGLPASIVAAVLNDPYTNGGASISVTKLLSPAYQYQLLTKHAAELEEDVADRIWSLMGQVGHGILERMPIDAATSVAEQRIFMPATYIGLDMPDFTISGAFDLLEAGCINDFKFTTVWSRDGKIEWEQQLNMLRLLCQYHYEQTGDRRFIADRLRIIAIYRDWQKAKAKVTKDYPQTQVESLEIPVWPLEVTREYMRKRVLLHTSSEPPVCTDDERWMRPPVFALMKAGRKSAVKLYDNKAEADAAAAAAGKGHTVIARPVEYPRCESYCTAAKFCPHWQAQLNEVPF
jgi:hypothetical protein